jgi:hypothetical protein
LSSCAEAGIDAVLRALPSSGNLTADDPASRALFARIILHDILRIRLNNYLDAYCLQHLLRTGDKQAARHLLTYLHEEFGHDEMLVEDLAAFGCTHADVDVARPLFSTELLIAYLRFAIDVDGALPDFVWNWFVEWYSARYNPGIVKAASTAFGGSSARGTAAHLVIDGELDHEHRIEVALRELLVNEEQLTKAEMYLGRILKLVELSFRELLSVAGEPA